jgi:leucyl/phenylalanyl-tRNA---protein transferase
MMTVTWLNPDQLEFPAVTSALQEPNGLVAAGGDLSAPRLLLAYQQGIFPWYNPGEPILWWSPDPRGVLFTDELKVSRSLRRLLTRNAFVVHVDRDFAAVVRHCSQPRAYAAETWINSEMQAAYIRLHELGYAHSIECYQDDVLVGGLYGIGLGKMFFGESMFHTVTDASKVAFAYLNRLMLAHGSPMIDCQMDNPHLRTLGLREINRDDFIAIINVYAQADQQIDWRQVPAVLPPW